MSNGIKQLNEYNNPRHFVAYTGIKLPLKLVNELKKEDLGHRNTFIRGYYDEQDRLVVCQKVVYGEIELEHRYEYNSQGVLLRAIITEADEKPRTLCLNTEG